MRPTLEEQPIDVGYIGLNIFIHVYGTAPNIISYKTLENMSPDIRSNVFFFSSEKKQQKTD